VLSFLVVAYRRRLGLARRAGGAAVAYRRRLGLARRAGGTA